MCRSSAEAEYRTVANAVAEVSWLRQLLAELLAPVSHAALVYCDNISTVYMSSNPVQHQRTKHVEIDLHFVRERVATGAVRVTHVPTSSQYADIVTKGLPSSVFADFRSSLNVQAADVSTAGGVRQIDCLSCMYRAWAVSRLGPWAAHPSLLDDREGNLVGSCFYKP